MTIDLNCDMGELPDAAYEASLMEHVTSASIACGGHAGDDATMDRTVRLALARGVRIGAHPGYPDPANFGRVELAMTAEEIERAVREQIARLETVARLAGARVEYVKPHGALYNLSARDPQTARAVGRAVAGWNPGGLVFGLEGSSALEEWKAMGLEAAGEGFADRRYQPDGTLRPRRLPGALIADPAEAAAQALHLARAGRVRTICVHGDTPGAVEILRACRAALSDSA